MKRTLIVGYGYLGRRVADLAVRAGDQVWATTRQTAKVDLMRDGPIVPLLVDWTDRRSLMRLPEVDRVLVAVSYDRTSSISRYDSQVGGLRNLVEVMSPAAALCYISTTGVYHQTNGAWVDETSPTQPRREGGRVHLQAEALLHQMRPPIRDTCILTTILRLAGIYGPGRLPRAADVLAGRPIQSRPDGFLNLIHVDDAAAAVMSAWGQAKQPMYVVSDDQPVLRADFYRRIAMACGVPDPTFTAPPQDCSSRMRSDSNKRVWNRRMRRDLLPKLTYPTYHQGLADLLRYPKDWDLTATSGDRIER